MISLLDSASSLSTRADLLMPSVLLRSLCSTTSPKPPKPPKPPDPPIPPDLPLQFDSLFANPLSTSFSVFTTSTISTPVFPLHSYGLSSLTRLLRRTIDSYLSENLLLDIVVVEWFVPISLPRYQNSFCRGQERSISSSIFFKEKSIPSSSRFLRVWIWDHVHLVSSPPPRYQNSSCRGQERSFSTSAIYNLSSPPLSRYQNSSCRGHERSFPLSSSSQERTFPPSPPSLMLWLLCHCIGVASSTPVCEGCLTEASPSGIVKGSAIWCFVAFALVTDFKIACSALVAVTSSNNRSLCVLFVPQGVFPLLVSNVVKVQGLHDDVVCLSATIGLAYLFIICFCVICLVFVFALRVYPIAPPFVII
ncbi:hypothetical protein ISN45_Aa05g015240 [Arabidopsis thaliana x Arabidopsis arenosa]|uniref:Transmembrane protein n=1 Tax=Arabidopsis thaliana x Arabidopsis arenosa TaxID=1240361 RepID=A0A8T1ZLC5_9BRAS|nr:hypothetical protein ISN45_Aa05g015240 [Arabidopsis thaliana x Arabidopsis arenosa]